MSTTAIPGRFTALPDERVLQETVTALEEHGFSVEVAGDLDAARQAVLAARPDPRRPHPPARRLLNRRPGPTRPQVSR